MTKQPNWSEEEKAKLLEFIKQNITVDEMHAQGFLKNRSRRSVLTQAQRLRKKLGLKPPLNPASWSSEQEDRLKALAQDNVDIGDICSDAAFSNKSKLAIVAKYHRLKNQLGLQPSPKLWSQKQIKHLIHLVEIGVTLNDLYQDPIFKNRSRRSIYTKYWRLKKEKDLVAMKPGKRDKDRYSKNKKYKKSTIKEVQAWNRGVFKRNLRGLAVKAYLAKLPELTSKQRSIIVGKLLGDASASNTGHNFRLLVEQSEDRMEYVHHLYELFKPWTGQSPSKRIIKNSYHQEYGVSGVFWTYSFAEMSFYAKLFYKEVMSVSITDRKLQVRYVKMVPSDIDQFLDPVALAYWYMDDGHFYQANKSIILCTDNFTDQGVEILISALQTKFGIDCKKVYSRKNPQIRVSVLGSNTFLKLVKPYLLKLYAYKLGKDQNQNKGKSEGQRVDNENRV
jgi:LAGLIDADG DNA endonuclease family